MKKLPIGIQSIEKILKKKGYVYVDKTGFAKELIEGGAPHYFLSRPRRFGKSVFLDTLSEIFKGNKNLFEGCEIYHHNYDWSEHPVIYFDFSRISNATPQEFKTGLEAVLIRMGRLHGIRVEGPSLQFQLEVLIEELAKKNSVVVLVDEYDQPIINHLKRPDIAEQNRDHMKNFFSTLKSLDKHLRFTFVTGVTKFSQVSLFSGPNNLKDITMDSRYATMMGYTEEELKIFFHDHIQSLASSRIQGKRQVTEQSILEEIRVWYNGYRFSERTVSVYNPYSTLLYLDNARAESYWYNTGTPSFLIDQIKEHPQSIVPLSGITASKPQLMDISRIDKIDLPALMFQTGYLTICDYHSMTRRFSLDFPNQEVKEAFINSLIKDFAPLNVEFSSQCKEAMKRHQPTPFFEEIKRMLVGFPYQLFIEAKERTYHAILLGLMNGMGFSVEAEKSTNLGRLDIVMHLPGSTYLFEVKLDKRAESALLQIHKKKYFEPYLGKGKDVVLIGLNFSSQTRNILDWKGEILSESGQQIGELSPSSNSK